MKRFPINISDFSTIIQEDYLYVDKTRSIYDLITQGKFYFLTRPCRFGKTLLLSTLKELFEGNRKLFKGLWIDSSNYIWDKHTVILLNFSSIASSSPEKLEQSLALDLQLQAKKLSYDLSDITNPGDKLKAFVSYVTQKNKKVVILIDEYDHPIVNNIDNLKVVEGNTKVINDFFAVIKGLGSSLRALFITGITQASKSSLFSELTTITNISLKPVASTLLGYTQEELMTYFKEDLTGLAKLNNKTEEEMLGEVQEWCGGFRFSKLNDKVYNPFSLHYLFANLEFVNHWFSSATPPFLVKLLKKTDCTLRVMDGGEVSEDTLSSLQIERPKALSLLFQTGYLTIESYNELLRSYSLIIPNREVKHSYMSLFTVLVSDVKDLNSFVARLF